MIFKPILFFFVTLQFILGCALIVANAAFNALLYVLVIALPLLILIKLGLNIIFGT